MVNHLSENIRALRKARGLTQEQLSEVLGVTAGAVYKWESRLSQPELSTIMELADFFDTSVDSLLGFEFRDNRLEAVTARLRESRVRHDRSGLQAAEKALKKYPHAFEIAFEGARLYFAFATETRDARLYRRALELTEQSLLLIAQNADPKISECTLYGMIAKIRLAMGETEPAVALLKAHNANGVFDDLIALTLAADLNRAAEAEGYLASALTSNAAQLIRIALGYTNIYFLRRDFARAEMILNWSMNALSGLTEAGKPCFLDKVLSMFGACLACAKLELGDECAAREALNRALRTARAFDAHPDYAPEGLKFIQNAAPMGIYDDIGETAIGGLARTVRDLDHAALSALWKELSENER